MLGRRPWLQLGVLLGLGIVVVLCNVFLAMYVALQQGMAGLQQGAMLEVDIRSGAPIETMRELSAELATLAEGTGMAVQLRTADENRAAFAARHTYLADFVLSSSVNPFSASLSISGIPVGIFDATVGTLRDARFASWLQLPDTGVYAEQLRDISALFAFAQQLWHVAQLLGLLFVAVFVLLTGLAAALLVHDMREELRIKAYVGVSFDALREPLLYVALVQGVVAVAVGLGVFAALGSMLLPGLQASGLLSAAADAVLGYYATAGAAIVLAQAVLFVLCALFAMLAVSTMVLRRAVP